MASLILQFSDLYQEVQKFLGTYNGGSPTTTATTDSKFIVNRAYQRFVNAWDWTFLKAVGKLTTEDDKWIYELPADFSYLTRDEFTFDEDDAYEPTDSRPLNWIHAMRSSVSYSGYPEYHCITAGPYTKETGALWQVEFYPTPDSAYTMWYSYRVNPTKLENDADIPIGGPDASDMLLELCLAFAESYKDETKAVHDAQVKEILAPLIMIDNRRRPSNLGSMGREKSRSLHGDVIETGTVTNLS